jgi:hypothetical protein
MKYLMSLLLMATLLCLTFLTEDSFRYEIWKFLPAMLHLHHTLIYQAFWLSALASLHLYFSAIFFGKTVQYFIKKEVIPNLWRVHYTNTEVITVRLGGSCGYPQSEFCTALHMLSISNWNWTLCCIKWVYVNVNCV